MHPPSLPSTSTSMSPIVKVTEEEPSLSILHEETLDETTFLDDLEEKETLLELDLTHCRLKHLSDLNLKRFTCLEKLSLRQNLFQSLGHDPPKDHRSLEVEVEVEVEEQEQEENGVWMGVFPTSLKELDLYDNSIVDLSPLHRLTQLEYLDVSFNRIKSIPKNVFQHMPHLKELYLASNRITQIEHLDGLHQLVTLELGANRIKVLDNLTPCVQLQSLWLGKNKLTELNHVSVLTQLRILSVQSNRLTTLVGIEKCVQLTELYVSHNGLTQLLGIEHLTQLRILDVCHNQLPVFPMLPKLTHLEEVWISHNQLSDWSTLEPAFKVLLKLHTLYLEGNPLQPQAGIHYRTRIKLMVPQLKQLDATLLRDEGGVSSTY